MYDGSNGDYDEPSTAVALYEYPDEELDELPRGIRYEGERRPAEVIEAIQGDLHWLCHKALEWGHDFEACHELTIRAEAYRALARSSMHWNIPMPDDDEDLYDDFEAYVFGLMVNHLIEILDQYTAPLQLYGWKGDQLGVWIDWDAIDLMTEQGDIVTISHPDELLDTEWVESLSAAYALYEDDGYVALYDRSGAFLWEAS